MKLTSRGTFYGLLTFVDRLRGVPTVPFGTTERGSGCCGGPYITQQGLDTGDEPQACGALEISEAPGFGTLGTLQIDE
jgi:hypothetical protein